MGEEPFEDAAVMFGRFCGLNAVAKSKRITREMKSDHFGWKDLWQSAHITCGI